ncbi:MAG: alpha/beta hydrolase [Patescibacteria group bacterium]|nr:alpha/beta hydrolase [Patescibacteria group bacterium]
MSRRGLLLIMPFLLSAWFFVGLNAARAANLPIEIDTIWTKAQSPIIASGTISVKSGVKLTIEPGVIIKLAENNTIIVMGELDIKGSAAEPVIITSFKDDSAGGDTNHDGVATKPAPGDWYGILANTAGAKIKIDYARISYGGAYYGNQVYFLAAHQTAEFSISHSNIINNEGYIMLGQSAVIKINYSNIYNPDFCLSRDPFGMGIEMTYCGGPIVIHNIASLFDAANNYWGHEAGPTLYEQTHSPEDIKGTLISNNITYQPFLTAAWLPGAEPVEPDPVILVPGIMGSWNVSGRWQLDPILHTYDNLWQALKLAGYEEDKTLFAFPYEWRQDNTLTAYQLKQKIDEVKSICNCDKVDIVAHSMGGLVARAYAESDYYNNDIDQLVFLGTPHQGSPKSFYTWEAGEGFDAPLEKIVKLYFSQEAHAMGYSSLFDYIQNYVKSVEQLLPDYAYLQNSGETGFRIYNKNDYPNNYPYNTFLENINSADRINQLASSSIKIMNFVGDTGDNTINVIKVSFGEPYWPMWKHGYAEESIRLAGDGTVPEISSSLFIPTKVDGADHMGLPTKAQKQAIEYLTGNLPTLEIADAKEPEKIMMVRIFSPADFIITAPDGKKLGKDFLSGQAVNEIAGAFYSGFDSGAEFAVIPDPLDGEYKVELKGTEQGEYKLSASLIDDEKEIDQEFSGSISADMQRDFNITYSAQAEDPLGELEPIDNAPPIITISEPVENEKYLHSDNLVVDYLAVDDFSGIAATAIMIDSQILATTTINLFDYTLGQHNLIIQAVDKAGNQAQAQVNFEIIASIDSTISDIEKIRELGWLKGGLYRPILINAFKLLDIEAKYFDKEQDLIEKLIKKTQDDSKLTDEQKQKLIEQYNKRLDKLKENRAKAIDHSLGLIEKLLNTAKKQNQLNQAGYDIIISNINYLRENL